MATPFNLVAQLQIQGPNNINQVVRRIQSSLNSVSANVNITLGRNAVTNLTNANTQLVQMSTNLANVTMNATRAAASIQAMVNALNGARGAGGGNNINVNLKGVSSAAKAAGNDMEEFGRVSALAVRRFAAFSIPAGFLVGAITGMKNAITSAVEYDKQMNRLQQVTMASKETLSDLSNEVTRLATGMGVASKSLAEVSVVLASAGYTAKEVKTALETLAQTQLASQFDDIKTSTDGAIAVMQQFKIQSSDLNKVFGEMTAVSRGFAVESRDIVTAIQHTGGAFKAAGGNVEELMALFTSVRATTRESAESIATGLRTILTRIERPRTIEYMHQLGIELQDMNGKFVGPYEAIKRMGEALKGLDTRDIRYSQVVEQLGGYRQVSKVIPALQETATMQKALATAQAGQNALTQESAIAQDALATKLTKVREEWLKLGREVVESKGFKMLAESALSFATALTQVIRALQPMLPLLTSVMAVKGISALASFAPGFAKGLHFARGGVVPGSGSGDTVPAMLEPGEFVLRKSAVQSLGASQLHRINQYGDGDVVGQFTGKMYKRGDYGAYTKEYRDWMKAQKEGPAAPVAETPAKTGRLQQYMNVINFGDVPATDKKRLRFFRVDPAYESLTRNHTAGGLADAINNSASAISKQVSAETGVSMPFIPITRNKVLGDSGMRSSFGFVGENVINAFQGKNTRFTGAAGSPGDFLNGLSERTRYLLMKEQQDQINTSKPTEIKAVEDLASYVSKGRLNAALANAYPTLHKKLIARGTKEDLPLGYASGGPVGEDTVPAMLTPGEFVVNRRAVNKIGVHTLHAMNKFAAGGVVGQNAGSGAFGGMIGIAGMSSLAQSFVGLESSTGKVIQKMTEFAFTIEGLRASMGVVQGFTRTITGAFDGGINPRGAMSRSFGNLRTAWAGEVTPQAGSPLGPIPLNMFRSSQFTLGSGITRTMPSRLGYLARGLGGARFLSMAGSAVLGAGLMAGSSYYDGESQRMATAAGGDASKLGGAESAARTSNILSGAGTGVAVGAAIGSVVPVIGTAVGAAVGGVMGGVIGALRDNTSALRDNASGIRAAKGAEMANESLSRLANNRSYNVSVDRATALRGFNEQFGALSDTDNIRDGELRSKRAQSIYQAIRGQASNVDQIRRPMVESSKDINDFRTKAGSDQLVRTLAVMQGATRNEVEAEITKDIAAFQKHTAIVNESAAAFRKVDTTLVILDKFAASLDFAAESSRRSTQSVGVYAGMGNGQYGQGWAPQVSGIIQYAMRDAMNVNPMQVNKEIGGLLSGTGIYGSGLQKDATGSIEIMRQLPALLREAVDQAKIDGGGQDITSYVRGKLNKNYEGNPMLDAIESNIGKMIGANREGGDQEFARQVRENSNKVAQSLGGEASSSILKPLADMDKAITQEVEKLSSNLRQYGSVIMEAEKRKVDFARLESSNERQRLEMRSRGTGYALSYDQMTSGFWNTQRAMVAGTGAGTDANSIGAELRTTQAQMDNLKEGMQSKDLNVSGPAQQAFEGLRTKAQRLEQALHHLSESTELVAAAQAKYDEATRTRDSRRSFLTSYVMGDMDHKIGTIDSIRAVQSINAGQMDIRHMSPHLVQGVSALVNQFENIKMPSLFGMTKNAVSGEVEGMTGGQWQDKLNQQYTAQIGMPQWLQNDLRGNELTPEQKKILGKDRMDNIGDAAKLNASSSVLTGEQQKYLSELEKINKEQITAFDYLKKLPEEMAGKIKQAIIDGLATFNKSTDTALTEAKIGGAETRASQYQKELKQQLETRQRAMGVDATIGKAFGESIYGGETDPDKRLQRSYAIAQQLRTTEARDSLAYSGRMQNFMRKGDGELMFHAKSGERYNPQAGTIEAELGEFITNIRSGAKGQGFRMREGSKWFDEHITTKLGKDADETTLKTYKDRFINEVMAPRGFWTGTGGWSGQGGAKGDANAIFSSMFDAMEKRRTEKVGAVMTASGFKDTDEAARKTFEANAGAFLNSGATFTTFLDEANKLSGINLSNTSTQIKTLTTELENIGVNIGKVKPEDVARINTMLQEVQTFLNANGVKGKVQAVPAGNVIGKADGGNIFQPRGTDTVPAMLTPGEFVVRREQAQKHRGLLEAINSGSGDAMYAADGGPVYLAGGGLTKAQYVMLARRNMMLQRRARMWSPMSTGRVSSFGDNSFATGRRPGEHDAAAAMPVELPKSEQEFLKSKGVELAEARSQWMKQKALQTLSPLMPGQGSIVGVSHAIQRGIFSTTTTGSRFGNALANTVVPDMLTGIAAVTGIAHNLSGAAHADDANRDSLLSQSSDTVGRAEAAMKISKQRHAMFANIDKLKEQREVVQANYDKREAYLISHGNKRKDDGQLIGLTHGGIDALDSRIMNLTARATGDNMPGVSSGIDFRVTKHKALSLNERIAAAEARGDQGSVIRLTAQLEAGKKTKERIDALHDKAIGEKSSFAQWQEAKAKRDANEAEAAEREGFGSDVAKYHRSLALKNRKLEAAAAASTMSDEAAMQRNFRESGGNPYTRTVGTKGPTVVEREAAAVIKPFDATDEGAAAQNAAAVTAWQKRLGIAGGTEKARFAAGSEAYDLMNEKQFREGGFRKGYVDGNNQMVNGSPTIDINAYRRTRQELTLAMAQKDTETAAKKAEELRAMNVDADNVLDFNRRGEGAMTREEVGLDPNSPWRQGPRGFAAGGYVDNVPAYLSQGEFVMNAAATGRIGVGNLQRLNSGGLVQYKAGGGSIGGGGGVSELALSSAAEAAMKGMSDSMQAASSAIQASTDPLKAAFENASSQFMGSSNIMSEAANVFKTTIESFNQSVTAIPKTIEAKVNNIDALAAQANNLNTVLGQFTQGLTGTVGQLANVMDNLNKASTTLSGLVGVLKDKLQITVTVTHNPITVKVESNGQVSSATGDKSIGTIAAESVKEIDKYKQRLDDFGNIA